MVYILGVKCKQFYDFKPSNVQTKYFLPFIAWQVGSVIKIVTAIMDLVECISHTMLLIGFVSVIMDGQVLTAM